MKKYFEAKTKQLQKEVGEILSAVALRTLRVRKHRCAYREAVKRIEK